MKFHSEEANQIFAEFEQKLSSLAKQEDGKVPTHEMLERRLAVINDFVTEIRDLRLDVLVPDWDDDYKHFSPCWDLLRFIHIELSHFYEFISFLEPYSPPFEDNDPFQRLWLHFDNAIKNSENEYQGLEAGCKALCRDLENDLLDTDLIFSARIIAYIFCRLDHLLADIKKAKKHRLEDYISGLVGAMFKCSESLDDKTRGNFVFTLKALDILHQRFNTAVKKVTVRNRGYRNILERCLCERLAPLVDGFMKNFKCRLQDRETLQEKERELRGQAFLAVQQMVSLHANQPSERMIKAMEILKKQRKIKNKRKKSM